MTVNRITPADARRLQAEAVPEKRFQADVEQMAVKLGYLAYHVWASDRSEAGFPDFVAANPKTGRIIIAELKKQPMLNVTTGRYGRRPVLSLEQRQWLDGLSGPEAYMVDRVSVHLWLPHDYVAGVVWQVLAGEPPDLDTTWRTRSQQLNDLGIRSTWEPYRPGRRRRK